MLETGVLSVALSVGQTLPLAGLGLALAVARLREAIVDGALFGAGLVFGLVGREWFLSAILSGPGTTYRLRLVAPLACLVIGLVLAAPMRLRRWLLPFAALCAGALLGFAIKLNDPSFHDPTFAWGATGAAIWLVSAVGLTGRRFDRPWLEVAVRILGSWLIAIGLLIGGAALVHGPTPDNSPPPADVPLPYPSTGPGAPPLQPPRFVP